MHRCPRTALTVASPDNRRRPAPAAPLAAALAAFACLLPPVAEGQTATTAPVPERIRLDAAQSQTPAGALLQQRQAHLHTHLDDRPERAIEPAKDVVALTIEIFGDTHPNLAVALTNLAIAQAANDALPAAIQNYEAAIRIVEDAAGSMSTPRLVNPLHGLADAHMASGAIELAIPVYERIIHISHVNNGPNNLDQVPTADALSRAWLLLGERRKATRIQESLYRLQQRSFGEASDGFVDALMRRARWYERTGDFEAAANSYRRAAQTLGALYGDEHTSLIEPLLAFAFAAPRRGAGGPAKRRIVYVLLEARRATDHAVRVARAHAERDPRLLPSTLVAQGDWLMCSGQRYKARQVYKEAWTLLDANPALHRLRDDLFAAPTLLARVGFDRVYDEKRGRSPDGRDLPGRGFVELEYSVDASGRPDDVRIADSAPAGLMDAQVYLGVPRFIYRPAFRDGVPVEFTGVTFRHRFRYDASRFSDRERAYIRRIRSERATANAARSDVTGGTG